MVVVQPDGSSCGPPRTCGGGSTARGRVAVAVRSRPRQTLRVAVDAEIRVEPGPAQVQRQRRRRATAAPVVGSTSSGDVVAGGQAELGAAARAARSRSGDGGQVAQGQRRPSSLGRVGAAAARPADPLRAGQHAPCARKSARSSSSSPTASPPKVPTNPARAATPALISSRARSGRRARPPTRRTPASAADRVVGVGHHQEGEVRRAEGGRQPQPHLRRRRRPRRRSERDEAEVGDRLVELGVAHRRRAPSRTAASRGATALVTATRVVHGAARSSSSGRLARRRRQLQLGRAPRCRRAWRR